MKECNEGILKWVPLSEVSNLPMPYTAGYVVKHYLAEGRSTEVLYGGIAQPDGVEFIEMKVWKG